MSINLADDFDRAGPSLGPNWTYFYLNRGVNVPVIFNEGYTDDGDSQSSGGAIWAQSVMGPVQSCQATIKTLDAVTTDSIPGLVLRGNSQNGGNGYFCLVGTNTFEDNLYCAEIWSLVNGEISFIQGKTGSEGLVLSVGDVIAFSIDAENNLTISQNGTAIVEAQDVSLPQGGNGAPGIYFDGGSPSEANPTNGTAFNQWSATGAVPANPQDTLTPADQPENLPGAQWVMADNGSVFGYNNGEFTAINGQGSSGTNLCWWNNFVAFQDDQWAQATVQGEIFSQAVRVAVRASSPSGALSLYGAQPNGSGNAWCIVKFLNWTPTSGSAGVIAQSTVAAQAGDVAYIQAQGTTITLTVNGVEAVSVTDSDISSGAPGLCTAATTMLSYFTDFSAGDFLSATVSGPSSVARGSTAQYSATVTGTDDQTVVWMIDEGPANGTIDATGLYTAPTTLPDPATATVRAVSLADGWTVATQSVDLTGGSQMANDTLQDTLNWCQAFYQWRPNTAGTNSEPAITSANIVQSLIMTPPLSWQWSRTEDSSITTVAGTTDYTIATTTFGWIEKVSLADPGGNITEIKDVYNNKALAKSSQQARPNAAAVVSYDGSTLTLRLSPAPDKVYTVTTIYQNAATALVSTSSTWTIPPDYREIYAQLLLGFLMDTVNDPRAQLYRRAGIAALLSRAEGLTETQVNAFLAIHLARDVQAQATGLRTQMGNQARSV